MSKPMTSLESAIDTLSLDEHRRLQRMLDEVVASAAEGAPGDLRAAWQAFKLDLLAHLHDEEMRLFRVFRHERPDETRQLLEVHERLRARLTELSIALDLHCLSEHQLRELRDELGAHLAREGLLLYPWARRHLEKLAEMRMPAASGGEPAALETWRIDGARSSLAFSLKHALVGEIAGRFTRWGGTLTIDPARPTASAAEVWVDLASIETGDAERDAHARSSQFFDVEQHPEARFVSTRIRLPDRGPPTIEGRLELHGVARALALEITDRQPADGDRRAVYLARGQVDRRDFGLRWFGERDLRAVTLGARVTFAARVEAVRQSG